MSESTGPAITTELSGWTDDLEQALSPLMQEVRFGPDERIFAEGALSDSFLIIDQGEVRVEVHTPEIDTDPVLTYMGGGTILGEVGVISGTPRSASAYAQTAVLGRRVLNEDLEHLYERQPDIGLVLARLLGHQAATKLVRTTEQLASHLLSDVADPQVEEMMSAATAAQQSFERWPEERVDALLHAIAAAVHEHAEELATLNVEETTIGNVPDKVLKIRFASLGVYANLAGKPGFGVIAVDEEHNITEIASPVGVVFGIVPVTNPVSTFVNKTLICLKSRNAVILSPHRATQRTTDRVGGLVQQALADHEAPSRLVQWVQGRTSRQKTTNFMRHGGIGLVLATGGPSMVKAAYSCGKPALGVGPGNAPVWIAPDADSQAAARAVIESKCFDNGLTCGAEQHLVVDRSIMRSFVAALEQEGAVVLDRDQTDRLVEHAFDPATGDLLLQYVGRSAALIAQAAGLHVADGVRLLVFRADSERLDGAAAHERLAPVLSLFGVDSETDALRLCGELLAREGTGHTAVVHTEDPDRARRFAIEMPASRVLVNTPASQGCSGVLSGLSPSLTLGCGTFGGNSTTDNVDYTHVRNVKREARIHYGNLLQYNRLAKKL